MGDDANEGLEIERKFLLSALPAHVRDFPCAALTQGYIPGEKFRERVRKIEDDAGVSYVRTLKAGFGLKRIEIEEAIDEALFEGLFACTRGARLTKRRYRVPEGALVWEVDEFTDRELVLAEVELPDESTEAPIPKWLAPVLVREVTDEGDYVNQNLAR